MKLFPEEQPEWILAQGSTHEETVKTEFFPDYKRYGKLAPLYRNIQIIEYADEVIAFWDGKSTGTKYVIDNCMKTGRKIRVFRSK